MDPPDGETFPISRDQLGLLLPYEHRLGSSARVTTGCINKSMGRGTGYHTTTARWYQHFNNRDFERFNLDALKAVSSRKTWALSFHNIKQSSAQAVAPTPYQAATSPHPFSRQIAAPSRIHRRSITPVPIRARRVNRH
uniref:HTH_48 domain-containing protein n=1 Tax=Caenorhabditis japonica TaxID=281687 RepID=A0A2Q4RUS2_CAEJA